MHGGLPTPLLPHVFWKFRPCCWEGSWFLRHAWRNRKRMWLNCPRSKEVRASEPLLLGSASFTSPSLHSFRLETASFTPEPAALAPLETFPWLFFVLSEIASFATYNTEILWMSVYLNTHKAQAEYHDIWTSAKRMWLQLRGPPEFKFSDWGHKTNMNPER